MTLPNSAFRLLRSGLSQSRSFKLPTSRKLTTLENYKHIYVFPDTRTLESSYVLSLLPTESPSPSLAIGSTTTLPPTPRSFTENKRFQELLQDALKDHASEDAGAISQAAALASTGSTPSLGAASPNTSPKARTQMAGDAPAVTSSSEGNSAGLGGWIHLSDSRRPPDFGRIAEPEDIFGSLQVDGNGKFVQPNGQYQPSGTYRIITNDGILGLSSFLLEKVVERLRREESKTQ